MVLSDKERNDIAMEVAEYWKYNCTDDDFYYNCADNVHQELQCLNLSEDEYDKENRIILNLINELYSKDNWEAIKFFEDKNTVCVQYEPITINDLTINDVWEISLEYNEVILYNSAYEVIGTISYYDIINISIGDKNAI